MGCPDCDAATARWGGKRVLCVTHAQAVRHADFRHRHPDIEHKCSVCGCGNHIYYKHHCMVHLTDLERHELQGTRELAMAGRY